ncbi:ATPase, F1/V1/A1 complex, alpha/beta subunit [Tanacetum coccineum]|uniref:ATPase, F1/V1/A1 complex, alpha/beta subunit n=1 Tax=Tanacetum coccineum TaxID=301880 RepID=A0ABQ5B1Q5_9ASTR
MSPLRRSVRYRGSFMNTSKMKNVDKNKGTIGDNNGAEEINTRISSDAEGFIKDSEIVMESKEDETVNVDCCSDTDAINIRNGSTDSMPTAQNKNNMSYVYMVTKLSSNSDNKLMFKATEMSKEGNEFGLKDVIVNNKGHYFFKFSNEEVMNKVIEQGPCSIGKPLIMDSMTANMCKQGFGRIDYARVLVEIDASKGFKDMIELMYKDKQNNCKGVKKVKVEYSWKPLVCDFCKAFGHVGNGCTNKPKVINVDTAEKASVNEKMSGSEKDSFTNVNYKRKNQVKKNTNIRTQQNEKIGSRDKGKSQQIPFKKPEVSQRKPDQNWKPK